MRIWWVGLALAWALTVLVGRAAAQQPPGGLARAGTAAAADRMGLAAPRAVRLGGLLGDRFAASATNRLVRVNEQELLDGFRHRPGAQAWIGEHVGKWLHAASLTWDRTRDPALRAKIDRVVGALIATQEPDGYLGTYVPGKRWGLYPDADWDVWVHKYDLIGLLTCYQYTRNPAALAAARRIGDLLIATFGPGRRSVNGAGTHVGMAATSVLEPMVLLYRATADRRYLGFARYLVGAWDEPGGAAILSSLRRYGSVRRVANGKAYEMLSNLCGLCELYRATGDRSLLAPVLAAWRDIVANRLYITGSGSSHEHWQADHDLPNAESDRICETCVTVTWLQLNLQLLRITGEARYANQLERTAYNHLLGAQKPSGDAWCYYTPLEGRKPYSASVSCCLSSGPRGVALLPTFVYGAESDAIAVNLYAPSRAELTLPGGGRVALRQTTGYPYASASRIEVERAPAAMTLRLRVPPWLRSLRVRVNGRPVAAPVGADGYAALKRRWRAGDRVDLDLGVGLRLAKGEHGNAGRVALEWGPLVLAADEAHNRGLRPITRAAIRVPAGRPAATRVAKGVFSARGLWRSGGDARPRQTPLRLVPFLEAGVDGSRVEVWLRTQPSPAPTNASLLAFGQEARSRSGNQFGSLCDEDPATFCVTFDGARQAEDWYAVWASAPVRIGRVRFCHGRVFHDGGWFDTTSGKPRIEVRRTPGGPWEPLALLVSYPEVGPLRPPVGIRDGEAFEARFAPVSAVGVRVVGVPACGDNPGQAFSSCGELQAFAR